VEEWMKSNKIPRQLEKRVLKSLECNFNKYKGKDYMEVLETLPDSLRDEILYGMFKK